MKHLGILCVLLAGAASASPCLTYDSNAIQGVLVSEMILQVPEDASPAFGPEPVFFVVLNHPTCITKGEIDITPAVARIERVQLIINLSSEAGALDRWRKLVGKQVGCTGVLFGKHIWFHYTDVVLAVTECHAT